MYPHVPIPHTHEHCKELTMAESETVVKPAMATSDTVVEPDMTESYTVLEPHMTESDTVLEPAMITSDTVLEPDMTEPDTVVEPDMTEPDTVLEPDMTESDTVLEPDIDIDSEVAPANGDLYDYNLSSKPVLLVDYKREFVDRDNYLRGCKWQVYSVILLVIKRRTCWFRIVTLIICSVIWVCLCKF